MSCRSERTQRFPDLDAQEPQWRETLVERLESVEEFYAFARDGIKWDNWQELVDHWLQIKQTLQPFNEQLKSHTGYTY